MKLTLSYVEVGSGEPIEGYEACVHVDTMLCVRRLGSLFSISGRLHDIVTHRVEDAAESA